MEEIAKEFEGEEMGFEVKRRMKIMNVVLWQI